MDDLNRLTFEQIEHVYKLDNSIIPSVTQIINPISKVVYENINLQTLMAKAHLGSKVHKLVERYVKFNFAQPDDITQDYFNNFLAFWNELNANHKVEIISTEFKGFCEDKEMVFGGTIDIILKVDDEIWLIDWKTVSKPIKLMLALQMYGYKKIVNFLGIEVDKVKAVQLTKKGYEMLDLTEQTESKKIENMFKVLYRFNRALQVEGLLNEKNKLNEEDL